MVKVKRGGWQMATGGNCLTAEPTGPGSTSELCVSNDQRASGQAAGTNLQAVISAASNSLALLSHCRHPLYEVRWAVASQRTNRPTDAEPSLTLTSQ
ncbi:hypothetical protein F2P81_022012 [Scophthalmus maximus]|uniref:Uncharacterized protein n=1 Tax=Scophthalmus maximus TaxID=52904 RepID=A0A6A4S1S7_SCOMX|nr:hypothetical protein F2P81_022012 [Scophthalmus maximus]